MQSVFIPGLAHPTGDHLSSCPFSKLGSLSAPFGESSLRKVFRVTEHHLIFLEGLFRDVLFTSPQLRCDIWDYFPLQASTKSLWKEMETFVGGKKKSMVPGMGKHSREVSVFFPNRSAQSYKLRSCKNSPKVSHNNKENWISQCDTGRIFLFEFACCLYFQTGTGRKGFHSPWVYPVMSSF